jgi:hypothetical protein
MLNTDASDSTLRSLARGLVNFEEPISDLDSETDSSLDDEDINAFAAVLDDILDEDGPQLDATALAKMREEREAAEQGECFFAQT